MNILRKYTQKIRGEMRILWKSIRYSPLIMSDREFDIKRFYKKFGDYPDIENPKTFNEKILYKKLYDRNPLLQTAADKYRVRDYVAERI